jgi:hypothetical protein
MSDKRLAHPDEDDYEDVRVIEEDSNEGDEIVSIDDEPSNSSTHHAHSNSRNNNIDDELEIERDEADEYAIALQQERQKYKQLTENSLGIEVKQFKKEYGHTQEELEYYELSLAEAINCADGEKASAVIKLRDEASKKLAQMDRQWEQAEADYQRYLASENPQTRLHQLGQDFCKRTGFYQLSEAEKKKWLKVDSKVKEMGYDPSAPEYWKKLENALKGKGLLKMNRNQQNNSSNGSGRSNGSNNNSSNPRAVKLSRERVEALEMAGYAKGTPEFKRMALKYAKYDQEGGINRDRCWNFGG